VPISDYFKDGFGDAGEDFRVHFGHQEVEFISSSLITVLASRECAGVAPFFVFAID